MNLESLAAVRVFLVTNHPGNSKQNLDERLGPFAPEEFGFDIYTQISI